MIGRSKLAAAADLRAELNAHNDLLQVFILTNVFHIPLRSEKAGRFEEVLCFASPL